MLEKEFQYYLQNQEDFVKAHFGRYVIIKNNKVIGEFSSEVEAILHAKRNMHLHMGTFLVHQCLPGKENYTQFSHSSVSFIPK